MSTSMDADSVRDAYDDVRNDTSETQWFAVNTHATTGRFNCDCFRAVFKYEGARIVCSAKGSEFDKFREQFGENERAFGYIRLQTGDEMSKRQKFLLVTWVGPSVSVIQRAKMSTDKALIKGVITVGFGKFLFGGLVDGLFLKNFAVELQLESAGEIDLENFKEALNRAGGANYGTGVRDI